MVPRSLRWGRWPDEDPLDPPTLGIRREGPTRSIHGQQHLADGFTERRRFGVSRLASCKDSTAPPFQGHSGVGDFRARSGNRRGSSGLLHLRPETSEAFAKKRWKVCAPLGPPHRLRRFYSRRQLRRCRRSGWHGSIQARRHGKSIWLSLDHRRYRSPDEYQRMVGSPLPATIIDGVNPNCTQRETGTSSRVRKRTRKPKPT